VWTLYPEGARVNRKWKKKGNCGQPSTVAIACAAIASPRPTAVVCGNDVIAIGALAGASIAGDADANIMIVTPLAWYKSDASMGTTLTDSSGNGKTGMLTGSAGWTNGVSGNALSLTGGRANLPNGIVSGLDDFTIATWVRLDSVDTWSRIFDFGTGTTVNMFLTPEAGGTNGPLRFAITTSGNGGEQQLNGPTLSAGTWYEIVSQSPFVVSADTIPVVGIPRYSAIVYANRTNEQLNIPVSVDSETGQNTPLSFSVSMNYPNPFNPSTSLRYDLPRQSNVRIEVFNMIGEVVSVILDSRLSAGSYTVRWDGMTSSGIPASSGMYIVRFSMDNSIETRKILLIR